MSPSFQNAGGESAEWGTSGDSYFAKRITALLKTEKFVKGRISDMLAFSLPLWLSEANTH